MQSCVCINNGKCMFLEYLLELTGNNYANYILKTNKKI